MKAVFVLLLALHGLIHAIGFVKAFKLATIDQFQASVTTTSGVLWALACLLFLLAALLLIFQQDYWSVVALLAVLLSQVLIVLHWSDAKWGTPVNILVFVLATAALANMLFAKNVHNEVVTLFEETKVEAGAILEAEKIQELPVSVQKWLAHSAVLGKPITHTVRLKQRGEMKTTVDGSWMPFSANQYVNLVNPGFVWTTRVQMVKPVTLLGRDKLYRSESEMRISIEGLYRVVEEGPHEKIDLGAMQRFLGEMCWYPSFAVSKFVRWEEVDSRSAKATLRLGDKEVSGLFVFSEEGKLLTFEADRYYGGTEDSKKEKWIITIDSYKEFKGRNIPNKCIAMWKLETGDFTWLKLEILEVDYNTTHEYESV
ncbi:DUF6544 family protein [Altibacter sp.]|uniref:DUF6544 family protein n=1 Tax=Altibacter sp. TaxID=2024823 RepID=UPI000C927DC3|nr:DUF6544 family protein [Altibacter sp.]MAP54779.1 hypothetical protein [Altibacter sp.]